jgi:hypothetical protein
MCGVSGAISKRLWLSSGIQRVFFICTAAVLAPRTRRQRHSDHGSMALQRCPLVGACRTGDEAMVSILSQLSAAVCLALRLIERHLKKLVQFSVTQ